METLANFHPLVVHFPLAIFTLYIIVELIAALTKREFFDKTAVLLLGAGILFGILAVLTGNQAAETANEAFKSAIESHQNWATGLQWYFTGLFVLRFMLIFKGKFKGIFRYVFLILALAGALIIYETGEHGGKLVYKYGIGTDLVIENPGNE